VQSRTAELRTALASLQQVDQRRRQLFADVSHELRTPATAIRGEAQVAMRGRDKTAQEYKESLERIVGAAAQLGQVIDDLLAVARDDIDALIPQRDAIDLRAPIEAALDQARALAGTRQVSVEDAALPAGPLPLLADAARLQQLLVLLLDNAVRYSRPGEAVRLCVEARQPADGAPLWEVRVEDHGIGIPEEEQQHLFSPFFRAHNVENIQGTGLGLNIVQRYVDLLRGEIAFTSKLSEGTTFYVTIPLTPAPVD